MDTFSLRGGGGVGVGEEARIVLASDKLSEGNAFSPHRGLDGPLQ